MKYLEALAVSPMKIAVRQNKGNGEYLYWHESGLMLKNAGSNGNLYPAKKTGLIQNFGDYEPLTNEQVQHEPFRTHYEKILDVLTGGELPSIPSKKSAGPVEVENSVPPAVEVKGPGLLPLFREWYKKFSEVNDLLQQLEGLNVKDFTQVAAVAGQLEKKLIEVRDLIGE